MAVSASTPFDFLNLFEQEDLGRRMMFEAAIPSGLKGPTRQAASRLFEPTFNQFLGILGQQIGDQSRQDPMITFRQYLSEKFDPQRELLRFPGGTLQRTSALSTPAMFSFQR